MSPLARRPKHFLRIEAGGVALRQLFLLGAPRRGLHVLAQALLIGGDRLQLRPPAR
jgi:hypothetical protein